MPRSDRVRILLFILAVTAASGARQIRAEDDDDAIRPEAEEHQMASIDPLTAKFEPIPNMPACATAAVVRGNPAWGPAWVLLKLASGCRVPWHWHTPNEDLVTISGQGTLEMKDGATIPIGPGVFAGLPSRHVHRANCFRSCLFFSISDGAFDIHYVDAKGEEIELEAALKAAAPTPKRKVQSKPKPKKK
jgi:hypothetical protein